VRRLLAVLTVVVIALSACAKTPPDHATPPGDALPGVLDALQKTNDSPSARMAIDLTFTSRGQTTHVTGTAEWVGQPQDPTSLRERLVLTIPSLGMMPGGKVEMIIGKGSVLYVRAPMLASVVQTPTPWLKLDPSSFPDDEGGFGAATAAMDPTAILAELDDALAVREVGAEVIDGADTTHYHATVDLVKLLPLFAKMSANEPTDAEVQKAKDQLKKSGLETMPVELWVGEDGFLAQLQFAPDLSKVDPTNAGLAFSMTLTFSDFGSDITIDIPPPSQVTDIGDVLKGLSSTTSA
jgi:hypothetical protein